MVLDGEEIKITINSLGQVEITGALGVSISSEGGQLSLNAPTISIGSEETASVSVAGASVSVGGPTTESVAVGSPSTAEVSVSGAIVTLGAG